MTPAATLAVALTVSPASGWEVERVCVAQAERIWTVEQILDRAGTTEDAIAAQHFLAGCRAGIAAAVPRPLETGPIPQDSALKGAETRGWGGLLR